MNSTTFPNLREDFLRLKMNQFQFNPSYYLLPVLEWIHFILVFL